MFIRKIRINRIIKGLKSKLPLIGIILLLVFSASLFFIDELRSDIITKNEVEDQNLLFTTVQPARPNVAVVYDNSHSSGTNFGGAQVGRWAEFSPIAHCTRTVDDPDNTEIGATKVCYNEGIDSDECRATSSHCVLNAMGITREQPDGSFVGCGSANCSTSVWGTCDDPDDFSNFLDCIEANYDSSVVASAYNLAVPTACDTLSIALPSAPIITTKAAVETACNDDATGTERAHAAAGIENLTNYLANQINSTTFPLTCGGSICGDLDTDDDGDIDLDDLDTSGDGLFTILDSIDPSCNVDGGDFVTYMECMGGTCAPSVQDAVCESDDSKTFRVQPGVATCTEGQSCGHAVSGSARIDAVIRTFFEFLDVDPSLEDYHCGDDIQPSGASVDKMFDGSTVLSISCDDYFYNTPFRDVSDIVTPNNADLPDSPDAGLDFRSGMLDDTDDEERGVRFRGVFIGGGVNNKIAEYYADIACQKEAAHLPQGGFAGGSDPDTRNDYKDYSDKAPGGRSPLANVIGHDDTRESSGGEMGSNDLPSSFRVLFQSSDTAACAPAFAILITDGKDTCSGDIDPATGGDPTQGYCYDTAGTNQTAPACQEIDLNNDGVFKDAGEKPADEIGILNHPAAVGNSNRRSAIQAVNTLRTHFVRTPAAMKVGPDTEKEVLTFVVCLGADNITDIRTCNAMALAGGTHSSGVIKHLSPAGEVGKVEPNTTVIASDAGLIALATAKDLTTNPANAWMDGCRLGDENEGSGVCTIDGNNLFDNTFFTSATTVLDTTVAETSFAFFADDPDELLEALEAISFFIGGFGTTGTAPQAPASSTTVFLRDRIYLALLKPNESEPFWQGRLALYGFVNDPDNPGGKVVIRKPDGDEDLNDGSAVDSLNIFNDDGTLDKTIATSYFWEAGKKLAERDLSGSSNLDTNDFRDIFTIKFSPDPTDSEFDGSVVDTRNMSIRYVGERVRFSEQISPTVVTTLSPEHFSISDADVDPDGDNAIPAACESSCDTTVVCSDITTAGCKTCVKNCLRDRVVKFFSGETGITPIADNLGSPGVGTTCTDDGNSNNSEFGCDCPDPGAGITGSDSQCSVRLGDMFHSAPVIVSSPNPFFFDIGFGRFVNKFLRRTSSLYIGSNSGAIHAFHAGELVEGTVLPSKNPFTLEQESVPFFDEGTGREMFAFIPGYFMPDTRSPELTDPTTPLSTYFNSESPAPSPLYDTPEYRFGDLKDTALYGKTQRSYVDGTFLIADVWIDGYKNGIKNDPNVCKSKDSQSDTSTDVDLNGVIDPCGKEWHTVMLAGNRNGGGFYTALDVTGPKCSGSCSTDSNAIDNAASIKLGSTAEIADAPQYPRHLWTLYDKHFGNTWSDPTIGRVRLKTDADGTPLITDRWIMFVGGGMDPENIFPNKDTDGDGTLDGADFDDNVNYVGNGFYAVDIATGEIIFKFHPSDSTLTNSNLMVCEVASEVGVFDLNADGYMDVAYVGDTCGRMWRFDVSMPIETDSEATSSDLALKSLDTGISAPDWTGSVAFCAGSDANCLVDEMDEFSDPIVVTTDASAVPSLFPIYFPPSVVIDDIGRKHVIFQTGDRREPTDNEKFGKLYNFIDDFIPAFLAGGTAVQASQVKTEEYLTSRDLVVNLSAQSGVANQFEAVSVDQTAINANGEFLVNFPGGSNTLGEKGIGRPIVANRILLFSTFEPDALLDNSCSAGPGVGRIFALDYLTGESALARIPGSDKIISGSDTQKAAAAGKSVGVGMPTPASLTFGERGSLVMTIAFTGGVSGDGGDSGASFIVITIADFPQRTQTLYWEELI